MKRRSFLSSIIGALFVPAVPALAAPSQFPRGLLQDRGIAGGNGGGAFFDDRAVNPPMVVDVDMIDPDQLEWLRPGGIVYVRNTDLRPLFDIMARTNPFTGDPEP